jgi:acetyl esterase/lipase
MDRERNGYLLRRRSPLLSVHRESVCASGATTMHRTSTSLTIPTSSECDCPATIHRAAEPGAPIVLHLHAGAFVSAPVDSAPCVVRLLVESGATVVSLQYPLAPDHPFPQAIEAAHASLRWLHRQRRRLSGADAALFVAGEEAGGNIAAAASLMSRDRGEPPLAGQILFSPMLDACVATASLRDAHAGPVGCRWADGWHQYLPRASDALHPYATPGDAVRLAGLPPTLLVTAHDDPFRDETSAFAGRLRGEGVPADELMLPRPTGFPATYMKAPDACDPPWAETARQRIRAFLASSIHTRRTST